VKEDTMDWLSHLIKPAVPSLTPAEAHRRQRAGALLIDVREPDEWRGGHAPGAKLIPLGQLATKLSTLPRDREILFICRSGNRSARATEAAQNAGLRASNVGGGLIAWAQARLPIER
jgi:rhodanese-related sulfurtransferase